VSQAALVALVRNLRSIQELNFHNCDLSDDVLGAIAFHCPRLRELFIIECGSYTDDGIVALAEGCTALRKVCIADKENSLLTYLGWRLWKLARPELEFVRNYLCNALWSAALDIEREGTALWPV
jgi:hypothetical protein